MPVDGYSCTNAELTQKIIELYRDNRVGCCLHIVTDDGNYEDGHVQFCVDWAREHKHPLCLCIAEELLKRSFSARSKIVRAAFRKK